MAASSAARGDIKMQESDSVVASLPSGINTSSLDMVEDELLSILKDASNMVTNLKELSTNGGDTKESIIQESATSIFSRLVKVQDGLLDNIDSLQDYLPFERSATKSRLKAQQARSDLEAANSILVEHIQSQLLYAFEDEEQEDESSRS
jgi:hypothetical protein